VGASVLDISVPFAPTTPPWPGDTACSCGWTWSRAAGASVNVGRIETSPHVGTHADAPLHIDDGAPGADTLPLAPFIGPAIVLDVRALTGAITLEALHAAGCPAAVERLILRTDHTVATGRFPEGWPTLAPDTVDALLRGGLRLLAVDCPSVDARVSTSLDVHHRVFGGGAYILENLDLRHVPAGRYHLHAAPLATGAFDAAPARALLTPLP